MDQSVPSLTYLSVVISHDGIAEMSGTSRAVFVARGDITLMELMRGTAAERPALQALAGLVFVGVGMFGVIGIINWLAFGGVLYDVHFVLPINLLLGGWFLWSLSRKRTFILVRTPRDKRKIVFKGRVDPPQLADFIEAARRDFDYPIRSHLPDSPPARDGVSSPA